MQTRESYLKLFEHKGKTLLDQRSCLEVGTWYEERFEIVLYF